MASLIFYDDLMRDGHFGLERETLRIDHNGIISKHKHPFEDDPYIERDFCENQIEIISPVCDDIDQLYASIDEIDRRVRNRISELGDGEYLWPFSNPPYVSEENIKVAMYHGSMKDKQIYRDYLSEKYGKQQMLFCGIHFNFSYSDAFLKRSFETSGMSDFLQFKNKIYLDLTVKVHIYSWLIVYLTAASPVMGDHIEKQGKVGRDIFETEASPRNGVRGYWNTFVPVLDYSDITSYAESINNYVKRGQLYSASECYLPVRVKPKGENTLDHLKKTGINHIELRMIDLNPLARLGIFKEDLRFIHLFLLYLTCLPLQNPDEFDKWAQQDAIMNHKKAARFDCGSVMISGTPLVSAGIAVLDDMERFFSRLGKDSDAYLIAMMKQRLLCPEQRYAQKIYDLFHEDYLQKGLELAKYYSGKDAVDLFAKEGIINV